MRPVKKWEVGQTQPPSDHTVQEEYDPHGNSAPYLILNLGEYCSYCGVFDANPAVEHIIPQSQDSSLVTNWSNFLLACNRCNGPDNKGANPVDLEEILLPHQDDTFHAFIYSEGGIVKVNPALSGEEKKKADKLMDLVKLDKYPTNPKYPPKPNQPFGFPIRDRRYKVRSERWSTAKRKLVKYENGELSAEDIVEFALLRGMFSVWYTVFASHKEVLDLLVSSFPGTNPEYFE